MHLCQQCPTCPKRTKQGTPKSSGWTPNFPYFKMAIDWANPNSFLSKPAWLESGPSPFIQMISEKSSQQNMDFSIKCRSILLSFRWFPAKTTEDFPQKLQWSTNWPWFGVLPGSWRAMRRKAGRPFTSLCLGADVYWWDAMYMYRYIYIYTYVCCMSILSMYLYQRFCDSLVRWWLMDDAWTSNFLVCQTSRIDKG